MTADHTVPPGLAAALRDRYELVRETGHGGSATVYLARDLKHDRFVALKVLNPDVGHTTGERFLREIQVSAGMQHPHILPTYDSGLVEGRLYFVMPFVDGGSLRQRLDAATALPVDESLRIAHDIAIALAHAHDLGVVHRDVKPENILFYHGHACLADFGVARAIEQMDATITAHGTIVGTPAYMSPEQFNSADFDGRSDVYSLACVLFEMIAGTKVYAGETARDVVKQRQRSAPSIRKLREQVPSSVDELLEKALATLPEDRYTDARAFARAIELTMSRLEEPERVSSPRRALEMLPGPRWAWVGGTFAVVSLVGLVASPLRDDVIAMMPASVARAAASTLRPYEAGRIALAGWDVLRAQQSFADAIATDPDFAPAHLWHAQSLALNRRAGTDAFRAAVMRLASVRGELRGRDSLLAAGLIALGEGQFPRACEAYERLRARDSLDVLAWYGLGDCHSLDQAILRDESSPSGWTFRGSWHTAAESYMRAVTIRPEAHAAFPYRVLTSLLPTDALYIRGGRVEGETDALYLSWPGLAGDSITWVPWPERRFATDPAAVPVTHPDALRRNRATLLAFARQWVAAAPRSADAHEALGLAHEARAELGDTVSGALGAFRIARRLSTTPVQRVRLAAAEVRMRVKMGDFARARALADSVLSVERATRPDRDIAHRLSGLAALTGRVGLFREMRAIYMAPLDADRSIAPVVSMAAAGYFARAATGLCDDTLRSARAGLEALLDSYSQPARRSVIRTSAIGQASSLAYPCLGATGLRGIIPGGHLDRAQRAHAGGNGRLAMTILDSAQALRRGLRPGDVSLQDTMLESWLRAASGDTAGAIRQLDLVLNALPSLGTSVVTEPEQAGALGRSMLLRAELASASGDRSTARRWSTHALALWSNADNSLRPTLDRLRALASN